MRSWLMMTAQPAKFSSAILKRCQRFGVEVVGRFVEQEDVAAGLQHLGEVHAVALTAGKVADLLLLVAALEVEGAAIGARIHFELAELDDFGAAGDFLPDGLVAVERVAALVDITKIDRIADADISRYPAFPGR